MDDRGAKFSQESGQGEERAKITPGTNRTYKARHLVKGDAVKRSRLLIKQARLPRNQHGPKPGWIEMRYREQGILLRAAQFQPGDDVANAVHEAQPMTRNFSASVLPWAMASSIEVCSQRP